jgi:hypothetical protein
MLTIVNFSGREIDVTLPESVRHGRPLLSTDPMAAEAGRIPRRLQLAANEGRLIQILT